ncbi:MAG: AraC family transcriptional regulator [Defluviitaleaceae bacterium]|nr:AraC family transcriptional regulator [Defluviitaleaceae bacterium]
MIKNLEGTFEIVEFEENLTVHLYKNNEYEHYPPHWHNAIEITMPLENIYTYKVNDIDYKLNEFDLIIIPPGEIHEIMAPPTGKRLIFLCNFSFFYNNSPFTPLLPLLTSVTVIKNDSSAIHGRVSALFQEMCHEFTVADALMEPEVYSKLLQILLLIQQHNLAESNPFYDSPFSKQKEYVEKMLKVTRYINDHYRHDITLEDLSAIAGYSKFHFSRIFKQYTGMAYVDYLNQVRIKAAENMMLNPNITITEIAMNSGFNSITTFNRTFKKLKNYTPSQFKEFLWSSVY